MLWIKRHKRVNSNKQAAAKNKLAGGWKKNRETNFRGKERFSSRICL